MTCRVSVVVPTAGRPELLRRCLDALVAQDFDPGAYEVIVVDDGPLPAKVTILARLVMILALMEFSSLLRTPAREAPRPAPPSPPGPRPEAGRGRRGWGAGPGYFVKWHKGQGTQGFPPLLRRRGGWQQASDGCNREPELLPEGGRALPELCRVRTGGGQGPAAARNVGWRVARGEIIAFTDDDCIPARDWLRAGVAALGEEVAGAAGRVVVPLTGTPTDYERDAAQLAQAEFVTANCFYRRAALAAAGGFDERFTRAWREDSDLYFTLLERQARLVHAPEAVVVHPVRPAPWGISLRQQRKSLFNALLYKKHPALYRQRIQPAPPWRYYAIVGALLAALGGALAGRRRAALGAASVWLLLTGRFCAQRLGGTSHAPRHVAEMIVTSALIPPLSIYWRMRGGMRFRVFFL
jgi:cellulose synthase/poly-beta-1,6-N-acetylglucosamine synthase-like glycosyltransferase